jgi:hypothetical protein
MELDDRTHTLDILYIGLDELERMRLEVVEKILASGGTWIRTRWNTWTDSAPYSSLEGEKRSRSEARRVRRNPAEGGPGRWTERSRR